MPNAPRTFKSNNRKHVRFENREPAHKRGYDWNWHKLRNVHLAEYPLCEHCLEVGKTTIAKEVDHIIPFVGPNDPLRMDKSNLQSLCKHHHAIKTRRENKRVIGVLHIICGPPGSGKTTYVNKHKRKNDIVFDFDVIAQALGAPIYSNTTDFIDPIESLRALILNHSKRADSSTWVIYTSIKKAVAAAQRFGGSLKIVDTPPELCIRRLRGDSRPCITDRIRKVNAWWSELDTLKAESSGPDSLGGAIFLGSIRS